MDLVEIEQGVDVIGLGEDRGQWTALVNTVLNVWVS
jgi:hypothetical protein